VVELNPQGKNVSSGSTGGQLHMQLNTMRAQSKIIDLQKSGQEMRRGVRGSSVLKFPEDGADDYACGVSDDSRRPT
jgi:hypothetical protein